MGIKHIVKRKGGFRLTFYPEDDESDHVKFIAFLRSKMCKEDDSKHAFTVRTHGKDLIDVDVHCGHVTESELYVMYQESQGVLSKYDRHLAKLAAISVGAGFVGNNVYSNFAPSERARFSAALQRHMERNS